jgi:hypothetical protein
MTDALCNAYESTVPFFDGSQLNFRLVVTDRKRMPLSQLASKQYDVMCHRLL